MTFGLFFLAKLWHYSSFLFFSPTWREREKRWTIQKFSWKEQANW